MKLISIKIFLTMICWSIMVQGQQNHKVKPMGQLVDLGGYKLHFQVKGKGKTTIVIEAGAGAWSLQWLKVQEELAKVFRVVTYDRGGYGWSEPSPYARTAGSIADELHLGLKKLKIRGPYILMGHSYGGFVVKAFAKKYPEDIKALILAEAASAHQFKKFPKPVQDLLKISKQRFKQVGALARAGKLLPTHIPIDSSLQITYWNAYQQCSSKSNYYDAQYNEMLLLPQTYLESTFTQPINKPVLVITAGNSFEAFSFVPGLPVKESNKVWAKMQKDLLKVSTNSHQHVIRQATHDLRQTAPEALNRLVVQFVMGLE